jgi:hypothetical protein
VTGKILQPADGKKYSSSQTDFGPMVVGYVLNVRERREYEFSSPNSSEKSQNPDERSDYREGGVCVLWGGTVDNTL